MTGDPQLASLPANVIITLRRHSCCTQICGHSSVASSQFASISTLFRKYHHQALGLNARSSVSLIHRPEYLEWNNLNHPEYSLALRHESHTRLEDTRSLS
ncbi:hypothetical protein BDZ91DRAFT_731308 [Kalaharituber pfeilii]|nr:hypothetical protein BDZ91DRAFT_731308 [Kalaharituber pfeilii]